MKVWVASNTNGGDEANASKVRTTVCKKKIGTKKWSEANLPQWTGQSFSPKSDSSNLPDLQSVNFATQSVHQCTSVSC